MTAPKNDSAASAPTVVEGVNQTDGQNESQVTIVADPMPIYKLTPSVPQEAINVQQTPVSTFRSILVPILADLDKSHPTNYVSLFGANGMITDDLSSVYQSQLATSIFCPFLTQARRFCGSLRS